MHTFRFIDLQVNGYKGVNFSDPTLTVDSIFLVCRALFEKRVEFFLPTVITSAWDTYQRVLPLLSQAQLDDDNLAKIAGIHLEGPYISPEDGARGVHTRKYVRLPSLNEFDHLVNLASGKIQFLTLAPELAGALELIKHAVSLGVNVSIGHTLASNLEIARAVEAGARFSTHLGNGLPLHIHRHNNPLWAQLANPNLTAMIIADGHHLPIDFVRTVIHCKGAEHVIVTSDASPVAGLPPGTHHSFDTSVVLEPDGRLYSPETGLLAGSSATLLECERWLRSMDMGEQVLQKFLRDNARKALNIN